MVPDADHARILYDVTQEVTAAQGLPSYEISNHARIGAESRHNLVYWRYHEYAGIGPGAHGRLILDGTRHATATEKRPESWLMRVEAGGHGIITDETLNREEMADEFLLMGLRLAEGIDPKRYTAFSGRPLEDARIKALAGVSTNPRPARPLDHTASRSSTSGDASPTSPSFSRAIASASALLRPDARSP